MVLGILAESICQLDAFEPVSPCFRNHFRAFSKASVSSTSVEVIPVWMKVMDVVAVRG